MLARARGAEHRGSEFCTITEGKIDGGEGVTVQYAASWGEGYGSRERRPRRKGAVQAVQGIGMGCDAGQIKCQGSEKREAHRIS